MELEFDKYCVIDGSPKTVLVPSHRHRSKLEKRKPRLKPKCTNHQFTTNEDFTELNFDRYRSVSCKEVPSKISIESNEGIKRGSVYQTSKEVQRMKKSGGFEGRRKIELPRGSATALSLGILDTLCSSDEDSSVGKCSGEFVSLSSGPVLNEREPAFTLHKSLSAKLAMPHSPVLSESDSSKPTSPKTRFSPLRKMFDPFVKSKSLRSPLGSAVRTGEVTSSDRTGISRSQTLRKSLLHDFSNTLRMKEFDQRFENKDKFKPLEPCLPAHLRGFLKSENNKLKTPVFEFSVKLPEENFVAKSWKVGQLYAFRAVEHKRKSSKESCLLGEMKVSSCLCNNAGEFDNSMVNEFVLFDKKIACQKKFSDCSIQGACELEEVYNQVKHSSGNDSDLHADQETAAIFIQVPADKTESLKYKRGSAKVNVVIPCGNHSFPAESGGPSPLLDRWRLGGGCDCGGWDIGCPLVVFGSPNAQCDDQDHPRVKNRMPLELFVQGKKEKTPALTITETEEGHYAVDFHAQLSALQAFAICVAILHRKELSVASLVEEEDEREKQLSHCDSLRVFIGEEVKYWMEGITTEEEEKWKTDNKIEEIQQSFVLNPPFSPISRV